MIEGLGSARQSLFLLLASGRLEIIRANLQSAFEILQNVSAAKNGSSKALKILQDFTNLYPQDNLIIAEEILIILIQKPSRYLQTCLAKIKSWSERETSKTELT